LEDDAAIEETLAMFERAGCPKESLAAFNKSVRWYNSVPPILKLPNASASRSGFQDFDSMTNLLRALPFRLPDAPHEFQLNCFDSVVLLASGELKHGLAVDGPAGPFAVNCITNGQVSVRWATTPLEAFNCSYGTRYIEKTAHLFRGELQDKRVGVVAGICGGTQLPDTTQRIGLTNVVLGELKSRWKKVRLQFPQRMEVVLVHLVNLPRHSVLTDHAGVLVRTEEALIYVEKAGAAGPFVRLDLASKSDLLTWLARYVKGAEQVGYTDFFATFNESEILRLPLKGD
jgi:hypothetical protein